MRGVERRWAAVRFVERVEKRWEEAKINELKWEEMKQIENS